LHIQTHEEAARPGSLLHLAISAARLNSRTRTRRLATRVQQAAAIAGKLLISGKRYTIWNNHERAAHHLRRPEFEKATQNR
jgi:hypothetical protein